MSYKQLQGIIDGIAVGELLNQLLQSNCFDGLPY